MLTRRKSEKDFLTLLFTSAQVIGTGFLGQLFLLVSGLLVARILGVTGRGYLAGLSLWPILLSAFGNLGVPVACTYYLSQQPAQARLIIGEAYRIAIVQIVILTGLLLIILWFWSEGKPSEVKIALYPVLLAIPALVSNQYAWAILQGRKRLTVLNLLRLLPLVLYASGAAFLFFVGEQQLLPVVVVWVSTLVLVAVASTVIALKDEQPDWRGSKDIRGQLKTFGLRGHLGAISPVDSLPIDQALVALFLSPTALGLYVTAYAFTNLPRFIAQGAGTVAYPEVASQKDSNVARQLMWRFFWGVSLLNLCVLAALIAMMPLLLPFFFGAEFSPAVPIARILVVGTTFVASRRILVEGLRGLGHPQASTIAEISMYPWLVIGGPILLLWYGGEGLAAALTGGYALSLLVAFIVAIRITRTFSWAASQQRQTVLQNL